MVSAVFRRQRCLFFGARSGLRALTFEATLLFLRNHYAKDHASRVHAGNGAKIFQQNRNFSISHRTMENIRSEVSFSYDLRVKRV